LSDLLDGIDWEAMGEEASAVMTVNYADLFALAYDEAASLGVAFDVENEAVQRVLDKLATKIKGISDTTRDTVRGLVAKQAKEGWSMSELAKAIREQGVTDSDYRSKMIARTESALGYSHGSLLAYGEAGVTEVDVYDGDSDPECAAANGSRWTLEEAANNPLGHPNCTRAFSAVVE
jgi:hypothetical protein